MRLRRSRGGGTGGPAKERTRLVLDDGEVGRLTRVELGPPTELDDLAVDESAERREEIGQDGPRRDGARPLEGVSQQEVACENTDGVPPQDARGRLSAPLGGVVDDVVVEERRQCERVPRPRQSSRAGSGMGPKHADERRRASGRTRLPPASRRCCADSMAGDSPVCAVRLSSASIHPMSSPSIAWMSASLRVATGPTRSGWAVSRRWAAAAVVCMEVLGLSMETTAGRKQSSFLQMHLNCVANRPEGQGPTPCIMTRARRRHTTRSRCARSPGSLDVRNSTMSSHRSASGFAPPTKRTSSHSPYVGPTATTLTSDPTRERTCARTSVVSLGCTAATRKSVSSPKTSCAFSMAAPTCATSDAFPRDVPRPRPAAHELADHPPERPFVSPGDDHVDPFPAERQRDGPADPLPGPPHERDLPGRRTSCLRHRSPLPRGRPVLMTAPTEATLSRSTTEPRSADRR